MIDVAEEGPAWPSRTRDIAVLAGLALLCAAVVAILALLARDQPSAGEGNISSVDIPAVSADDGCQNFGHYWS